MGSNPAILRGVDCPVPEGATMGAIIAGLVREHPLGSFVEIDGKNRARTLSVSGLWTAALSIIERVRKTEADGRAVLVICLDSFLDLMAAGWAAAVLDRDCQFWHVVDGHESARDFSGQWRALRELLGDCQLITRSRLLREFGKEDLAGIRPPLCIDRIPRASHSHDDLFCRDRDQGRIFVRTSGTTGTGKLAILPFSVQVARTYASRVGQRNLITLSAVPMDNITGISSQILTSRLRVLISPAAVAIDPLVFLKAIERFGVEEFVASTSFAERLTRTLQNCDTPLDLSTVRHLSVGFEPIASQVFVQLIGELERRGASGVRVSYGYGLTEVGRAAVSHDLGVGELHAHIRAQTGPFPLAACAPGRAIRIVDGAGNPLPQDEEGEIQIHAPGRTIAGYLQPGGRLVPVAQADGWVLSGDIGKIGNRGLMITGRSKGIIFSNGKCIALEPVEQAVRESGMVEAGLVAAAPLEDGETPGDYVVMACPATGIEAPALTEKVRQLAAAAIGIRPASIVVLPRDRFVFTATGKLKKREMARLHGRGEPVTPTLLPEDPQGGGDPLFAELCAIWSDVLKLQGANPPGRTFFELGGDSITAMEFLHRAELALGVRMPAERFFARPTLEQVWEIFCRQDGADADGPVETGHCLERLSGYLRAWRGSRLHDEAFLRGLHTGGSRMPIFWVFQSEEELLRLAAALGEDQPLYGMRSLHQILQIRQATDPILREVANQYLTELLALMRGKPFVLGGNCQGAIVALRMAQALADLGSAPASLVLMEWTWAWGRYAHPVLLLYGNRSHTATAYETPGAAGLPWQHDFPNTVAHPIEGAHGQFFQDENISSLSARLLDVTDGGGGLCLR